MGRDLELVILIQDATIFEESNKMSKLRWRPQLSSRDDDIMVGQPQLPV